MPQSEEKARPQQVNNLLDFKMRFKDGFYEGNTCTLLLNQIHLVQSEQLLPPSPTLHPFLLFICH